MKLSRIVVSLAVLVVGVWIAVQFSAFAQDDPFGGANDSREVNDPFGGGFDGASSQPTKPVAKKQAAEPKPPQAPVETMPEESESQTPVFWVPPKSDRQNKIEQKLRDDILSLGLEFQNAPLSEVVDFLKAEYNVEIELDIRSLDDFGISADEPVTANLRNISLRCALELMLGQLDLTYVVRDEVLLITTQDAAKDHVVTAIYPVGDLLQDANAKAMLGASAYADHSSLVDLLVSCVEPTSWATNQGGPGNLRIVEPGLLVVRQTPPVHEEIKHLIAALRKAKESEFAIPLPIDPEEQRSRGAFGGMSGHED